MNKPNQNTAALIIGFFMIALVAALTLSKNQSNIKTESLPEKIDDSKIRKVEEISSEELFREYGNKENFFIVDVRMKESFESEHIVDSASIPLNEINSNLDQFDEEKKYVIIDENGSEAVFLAVESMMRKKGLRDIKFLSGGFMAWKKLHYPVVSLGNPSSIVDQSKVAYINSGELKYLLDKKEDLLILDVRQPDSFQREHIETAANFPIRQLENKRSELPFDKKIILYDDSGLLAFQAGVKLYDLNFFQVRVLSDGLEGWKKSGFETVSDF